MKKHPQISENIDNFNNFNIHESDEIKQLVSNLENTLDGKGRVILRPSGTEPLIRLMLEGEDIDYLHAQMKELRAKVEEIVN
jgi:phosphoglucosamine mutase